MHVCCLGAGCTACEWRTSGAQRRQSIPNWQRRRSAAASWTAEIQIEMSRSSNGRLFTCLLFIIAAGRLEAGTIQRGPNDQGPHSNAFLAFSCGLVWKTRGWECLSLNKPKKKKLKDGKKKKELRPDNRTSNGKAALSRRLWLRCRGKYTLSLSYDDQFSYQLWVIV